MTTSKLTPTNPNWQPGDAPETHPMFDAQVQQEYGMLRAGANKVRDQVIIAKSKDRMTDLKAVRYLADDWVPAIGDAIKDWIKRSRSIKGGGTKSIALPLIEGLDHHLCAMVGVRAILNHIAKETYTLSNVAQEIGSTLEHEAQIRLWSDKHPEDFWSLQKEMDRKKVTTDHRRRTNVNRFSNHLKVGDLEGLKWASWTQEQRFRVGWTIMDLIIMHTGWFEVIRDPRERKLGTYAGWAIKIKQGLSEWVQKALEHEELTSPTFKPAVMPPKRWTDTRDGGYWTDYVRTPRFIRFKASQEQQRHGAADEYDAFEMPRVYKAVNALQETAYQINGRVLDTAIRVWEEMGLDIKDMPARKDRELPVRSEKMLLHREQTELAKWAKSAPPMADVETLAEIEAWKKAAHPIHAFNAKRVAKQRLALDTLSVAKEYREFQAFYFPHMLDFRCRLYPISAALQPQSNDLARGLLTYATQAPITEENGGVYWLAVQVASTWGMDKLPFEERVQWVHDNADMLRATAEDPVYTRQWMKADKPFQALAATFDWAGYLAEGDGYLSSLPIMVDGTCNGLQHLSALTRDAGAGQYVNLTEGDRPQDIYRHVANKLLQMFLEAESDGEEMATWWLDLCQRDFPRTLTKRQVMVLPYGGTQTAFFAYIREWLRENHPKVYEADSREQMDRNMQYIGYMGMMMWKAVNDALPGAMKVMKWLQDCAKVAAVADQPIWWDMPSGFTVRQFYGVSKDKRVDLMLSGELCRVQTTERTKKLSVKEQVQGIAPNYIHSIDGCCCVETICDSVDAGIKAFTSVHDAYGTHAANMNILARLLREAFVRVHSTDLLGSFRASICRVVADVLISKGADPLEAWEKASDEIDRKAGRLEMGDLDINNVLKSQYFFA